MSVYAGALPSGLVVITLIIIGFCVGVIGAFFGVGGAFIATPALNILGFPMAYAIGTDLAHMTGKSVVAALKHKKLGNVDMKAAGLLLIGTLPGVKLGAKAVISLESMGMAEFVLRTIYIALLMVVGSLILRESLSARRGTEWDGTKALLQRKFRLKPIIALKASGIESISIWGVILLGFVTGFLAAFLGVGGGFVRMPGLLYLLGMPTNMAVGTDLLEVLFSGGYGMFLYAREARVDMIAALTMLLGASIGSHLGALATRCVQADSIRLYFALTVLGSGVAVGAKQADLKTLSAGILLFLGTALTGLILYKLARGLRMKDKRCDGSNLRRHGDPAND